MPQTILVTGATTGFGRLTVETLARQGHTVFAGMRESAGRNQPAASDLPALAATEPWAGRVVELDVVNERSVAQGIEQVIAASGRLDVVVNSAGVSYAGPIEAFTIEQAQALFNTNVFGALRLNLAALPDMRTQGSGLLVQIGSFAGRIPIPRAVWRRESHAGGADRVVSLRTGAVRHRLGDRRARRLSHTDKQQSAETG